MTVFWACPVGGLQSRWLYFGVVVRKGSTEWAVGPFFILTVGKMSAVSNTLQQLVSSVVTAMGYELVGVEYLPRGGAALVRIFIDSATGITLSDCEKVSHQVSGVLDVEDPIAVPFTLEVSSPGLDRPLFSAAQFAQFAGREVRIRLHAPEEGRRNFRGHIISVSGDDVRMNVDGVEFTLPVSSVEKANLVPEL